MSRTAAALIVVVVAAAACSKSSEKSPTEKVKEAACACTDKACAEGVVPLYDSTSKAEAAKAGGWTKADKENMTAAAYCLDKFMLGK